MSSTENKSQQAAGDVGVWGVYLRVSSRKQAEEGLSLDSQKQRGREEAERQGGEARFYVDAAVKGTVQHREKLDEMMAAVERGELCGVITQKVDRLGRTQRHLHHNLGRLTDKGLPVIAYADGVDTATAAGRLLVGVLGAIAESELDNLRDRVMGAQEQARQLGHHAGRGKYGYTKKKGLLIRDRPDEEAIVQRIHAELHAGIAQAQTARGLGEDGVPTATGKSRWWQSNIQKILRDPIYAGLSADGSGPCPCGHEAIISMETWERTCTLLGSTGETRGRRPTSVLFRKGMLTCGLCGESMMPRSEDGGKYICVRRHREGVKACPMPLVDAELIDSRVLTHFQQVGLSFEDTCRELANAQDRQLAEVRSRLERSRMNEQKIVGDLVRIRSDYMDGNLPPRDWTAMRDELETQQKAATAETMRLLAAEAEMAARDLQADVEQTVLEHFADIRAAIATEVGQQDSLDSLRAALLALFEGFTLHNVRLGSDELPELIHGDLNPPGWIIEPRVRPDAIAKRSPTGRGVELHRIPLAVGRNKQPSAWLGW